MKLRKLLGWGIVIYSVSILAASYADAYGFSQTFAGQATEFIVVFIVCIVAGASLKFRRVADIVPYSIGWALMAAALDALYIAPTGGLSIFADWTTWAAYALIALMPLCAVFFRRELTPSGVWEH